MSTQIPTYLQWLPVHKILARSNTTVNPRKFNWKRICFRRSFVKTTLKQNIICKTHDLRNVKHSEIIKYWSLAYLF